MDPPTRWMKRPSPPQACAFAAMATNRGMEQAWDHVDRRCGIGGAKQGTDGGRIAPIAHALWVWRHGLHGRNVQCACHRKEARHCMQRRNALMEAKSHDLRARSMSSTPPPAPTTSAYTCVWVANPLPGWTGDEAKETKASRTKERKRARLQRWRWRRSRGHAVRPLRTAAEGGTDRSGDAHVFMRGRRSTRRSKTCWNVPACQCSWTFTPRGVDRVK